MSDILVLIAPIFGWIAVSAVIRLSVPSTQRLIAPLNWYALHIGLPALLFLALTNTPIDWYHALELIGVNSVYFLSIFIGTLAVGKLLSVRSSVLRTLVICLGLGNVAYLGIPLLQRVYGLEVLGDVAVIVAVYIVWVFSVGVGYLEWTTRHHTAKLSTVGWSLVRNPILGAVIIGIGVSAAKLSVPSAAHTLLSGLSNTVTPIVLFVIGLTIGSHPRGKLRDWLSVCVFSSLILVIFPAIFWQVIVRSGGSVQPFVTSILSAAMPLAITPFALADKYRLDQLFIARAIVVSTLLSALTLPVWVWVLG